MDVSAASPSLRLMLLVKNDSRPTAGSPPATNPRTLTCVGSWARATVSAYGSDRWRIRSVKFFLGRVPLRVDQSRPYQVVLRDRLLTAEVVTLRAAVQMRDRRRAELALAVRRC